MGVSLDSLFFKVSHKSMARLWRQDICQEVSVEEDALQVHKKSEDTRKSGGHKFQQFAVHEEQH